MREERAWRVGYDRHLDMIEGWVTSAIDPDITPVLRARGLVRAGHRQDPPPSSSPPSSKPTASPRTGTGVAGTYMPVETARRLGHRRERHRRRHLRAPGDRPVSLGNAPSIAQGRRLGQKVLDDRLCRPETEWVGGVLRHRPLHPVRRLQPRRHRHRSDITAPAPPASSSTSGARPTTPRASSGGPSRQVRCYDEPPQHAGIRAAGQPRAAVPAGPCWRAGRERAACPASGSGSASRAQPHTPHRIRLQLRRRLDLGDHHRRRRGTRNRRGRTGHSVRRRERHAHPPDGLGPPRLWRVRSVYVGRRRRQFLRRRVDHMGQFTWRPVR